MSAGRKTLSVRVDDETLAWIDKCVRWNVEASFGGDYGRADFIRAAIKAYIQNQHRVRRYQERKRERKEKELEKQVDNLEETLDTLVENWENAW